MRWYVTIAATLLAVPSAFAQAPGQPPPKAPAPAARTVPSAEAPVPADPQTTLAAYGDWILMCQKVDAAPGRLCEVNQSVQVQGQPGPITRLAVAKDKSDGRWRLTVVLPANVSLQKPVKVAPDEKDPGGLDVAWVRCLPGGCFATAALADDAIKAWRAATARGRVAYQDGLGQDVTLPFSTRGFAQALDALLKQ